MMLPMSFYLGIDAGGTKTVCILGDESQTLARATGGSIKHMRVGEEQAALNLQQVVKVALTKVGILGEAVTASCVGTAGCANSFVRGLGERVADGAGGRHHRGLRG